MAKTNGFTCFPNHGGTSVYYYGWSPMDQPKQARLNLEDRSMNLLVII